MPEDPLFVQVMKAGFGDMLARHGFEPVKRARAHYVLEGDGVTWRVMLGPARSGDPLAFKDITSLYVHGLDEFAEQFFDQGLGRRLWNTRYLRHHFSEIQERLGRRIMREWEAANPPLRPRFLENLRLMFGPIPKRPSIVPSDVPYMTEPGKMSGSIWDLNNHDVPVKEVAATVGRYWEAEIWPEVQSFLTKKAVLEEWGKRIDPDYYPLLIAPFRENVLDPTVIDFAVIALFSGSEELAFRFIDEAIETFPTRRERVRKEITRIQKGGRMRNNDSTPEQMIKMHESTFEIIDQKEAILKEFRESIKVWVEDRRHEAVSPH